jgi:hypothetical protein
MAEGTKVTVPVGGYRNAPGENPTQATVVSSSSIPNSPGGVVGADTPALTNAATGFKDVAGRLSSLSQTLENTLTGNNSGGDPWGPDTLGQSFGPPYLQASGQASGALQGLANLLEGIAGSLTDTTQTFVNGDEVNAQIATTKA